MELAAKTYIRRRGVLKPSHIASSACQLLDLVEPALHYAVCARVATTSSLHVSCIVLCVRVGTQDTREPKEGQGLR